MTRRCNLSCEYCKIIKKRVKEISVKEWEKVFDILNSLNVRFVKLMGGEPTLFKDLERLIKYANENTRIRVAVFSNSIFNKEKLESLIAAGLKEYITSIDTLKSANNVDSVIKSQAGLKALIFLKKKGITHLQANIVVCKNNILEVSNIIEYLSERGICSSLSPIHWGKEEFWEYRCKESGFKLTKNDLPLIKKLSKNLLKMKKSGTLIANSELYIKNWPEFAINLKWFCKIPPVLWIDSDGSMMCCCDIKGKNVSKYSVFDLANKEKLECFTRDAIEDVKGCRGCFYNCQYDALVHV